MKLWATLVDLVSGRRSGGASLPSRRERREAARQRHRVTGEAPWTSEDRQLEPEGERWVADVAPGTPGHYGSVRTIKDD